MMRFLVYFGLVLVTNFHIITSQLNVTAQVKLNWPKGSVKGQVLQSFNGKEYFAFQNIPYAAPPIQDLRFQEPERHEDWNYVMDLKTDSVVCMQEGNVGTEDCLVLNVFTPVVPGSARIPVFVWIHGGSFKHGQCSMITCGPKYFMDYGVIVVTVNYRLGPFGFLTTEDGVIPGNNGLKDQLLALKWVYDNIQPFGGDPTHITLGGQSAGAISVGAHILSQKATGFYRAAIMQSASAVVQCSYVTKAREYAMQMGKILEPSFNGSSSIELSRILNRASAESILEATTKLKAANKQIGFLPDLLWGLVIEKNGKNPYLTAPMHQALIEGKFDKVPILTGFTSEEVLAFVGNMSNVETTAAYNDKNSSYLISDKYQMAEEDINVAGEELKKMYTNSTFSSDLASFVALSSELGLVNPIVRQAALSSKHVNVYLYQFSYKGVAHQKYESVKIPNVDGIAHSEELYYMWPRIELDQPRDIAISKVLIQLWTNFIKTLDPTPSTSDEILGNFSWPNVKGPENIQYANINDTLSIESNPKRYKLMKNLYEKYVQPPHVVF